MKLIRMNHSIMFLVLPLSAGFLGQKGGKFPLSLCMEMRVMRKSDCLLCPASVGNEKHIAYIEVLSTVGTPDYLEYFEAVAKEWIKLGGIPHWHKQFMFLEKKHNIISHIKKQFGDRIDRFNKVRKELDPNGVFLNEAMKSILVK